MHLTGELLDAAAAGAPLDAGAAEHLRECAECRVHVTRLQALRAQLAALPRAIEPETDAWPRVRDTIRVRRARRRAFVGGPALALAAAALIAVVRIGTRPDAARPATNELAELRGVVAPVVADAMAANLTIYDAALKELEAHAASERENSDVQQRIDDLRRKRAALLRLASNS